MHLSLTYSFSSLLPPAPISGLALPFSGSEITLLGTCTYLAHVHKTTGEKTKTQRCYHTLVMDAVSPE